MSQKEKLIGRLLSIPHDFTWEELSKVLNMYGFSEIKKGKTGGSRRKFADSKKDIIAFHKPHPSNIVKEYAIKEAIAFLKEKGHIKDE